MSEQGRNIPMENRRIVKIYNGMEYFRIDIYRSDQMENSNNIDIHECNQSCSNQHNTSSIDDRIRSLENEHTNRRWTQDELAEWRNLINQQTEMRQKFWSCINSCKSIERLNTGGKRYHRSNRKVRSKTKRRRHTRNTRRRDCGRGPCRRTRSDRK